MHDVELVGAQRGEHLRRIAQRADTRIRRPSGWKSSKNTWAQHVGARRVVGAVDDHERLGADHLEPTRHRDVGEPLLDDVGRQRAAKNASTAVSATAALSPWCAPCSGRNTSG